MEPKACIWLLGEGEPILCRFSTELIARGWRVERFEAEGEHRDEDRERVGLVFLEGDTPDELRRLETMMLASHFPWLAVVDLDRGPPTEARRLILDLCVGCLSPSETTGALEGALFSAARLARLQCQEAEYLAPENASTMEESEYEMVGTTPAMWQLFKDIRKVAAVDASVCIQGESGTGKELTAQAIHERSPRAGQRFHAVNCGALPDKLIQSELFGHEKGAFTGATERKIGRIEAADGGTLFLDEIGDLPLELQVNLLRFLETRCIQRVGGLEDIAVDVRVLAATHVDLTRAVEEGRFREDLYHRLNVLQIQVPALRQHSEDIEILARFFFTRFAADKPPYLKGFSKEAMVVMRQYPWPGNVRELINRVRRAMVMCENRLIQPCDLGIERRQRPRHILTLEQYKEAAEREALIAALGRNKQRVHPAAKELGVSRVTIYRLLEKHGIARPDQAPPSS